MFTSALRQPFPKLLGLFILGLVGLAMASSDISATITTLQGKVEIKKAGTYKWVFAKEKAKLHNNDMLRTYKASKAELRYDDGSALVVRENSQILLNHSASGDRRWKSKYVTTFFGAIFFLVQEALPKSYMNRVYTPTAVVSIRGTSFGVGVDPKTGLTDVEVVNGTVLVRNILMDQEHFVKAGTKTQVALNRAPTAPRAIRTEDLESLKLWVGEKLIGTERSKQRKREEHNAAVLSGKAEDKILVTKLIDVSGFKGPWDISSGLTRFLAGELKKATKSNVVISRGNGIDADDLGRREKARLVVSGEIETFELAKHAEISVEADRYAEYFKASVTLLVYVVDPAKGTVVKTMRLMENVRGKDMPMHEWKNVKKYAFDIKNEDFKNSLMGKAVQKTLTRFMTEVNAHL